MQFYRELLGVLERKSFVEGRSVTPREFGAAVEARGRPELSGVSQVVESYFRIRSGRRSLSESERHQIDRTIRRLAGARRLPSVLAGRTTIASYTSQSDDHC